MVRTDSTALTLDKFLNTSMGKKSSASSSAPIVPVTLMSVKRLIYEFETDYDQELKTLFKKHSFVGMLTPE